MYVHPRGSGCEKMEKGSSPDYFAKVPKVQYSFGLASLASLIAKH